MAKETWKKMAEAFGRAVRRPGTGTRGKSFGDAAERADAGFEFNHGRWQGDMAEEEAAKAAGDFGPEYQEEFDKAVDKQTDERLKDEFKRAFDEAAENHGYKKWKEESKDMPLDDGFKGDLHDVNREDAVQRSREEIIKALQQNTDRDVTDVLRDFGYIIEE